MRKYILSIGEKKSIFSHVLYCVHSHICNHRFSNLKDVSLVMRVPRNSSFHLSVKNFESTCVKDRLNYVRCTDMDIFTKACLKVGFINDENLLVASFFPLVDDVWAFLYRVSVIFSLYLVGLLPLS